MNISIGDQIQVRINKIQENGCFCSICDTDLFGFLPKNLMPSYCDGDGKIIKAVNDTILVYVKKINSEGLIMLSDVITYEKDKEKRERICAFASEYEIGTIFEAEVIKVSSSKATIRLGDVEGIITKEEIYWNEINQLSDLLYEGEIINVVFLRYEKGHLYFSLKYLDKKPYDLELYDLSLTELLRFAGHKSNEFIGVAKRYHYGLFIENLYSDYNDQRGKLLIDPIYGYNLRALVLNNSIQVHENHFYKITVKLLPKDRRIERNQLFQFVATKLEEVENPYKNDVCLTFEKLTSPKTNIVAAHLLAEVGKDMYSSKDRMFFELIQNADDAAAEKGVFIKVKTNGDYLIVQYNGKSFDKDDFEAITSAANGTKKANENQTGYKGIGFKSVFTDSEQVFIKTGGYQFKFDKSDPRFSDFDSFYFSVNRFNTDDEKQLFLQKFGSEKKRFNGVNDIPWQLEPIWIDDYPKILDDSFLKSNVAIALKLGENKIFEKDGYLDAIQDVFCHPKFMLFLRNTKRIDFNGESVSKNTTNDIIVLKNSFNDNKIEKFKRKDYSIEISNRVFEENEIGIRIVIEDEDLYTGKIIEAKFVDLQNQELDRIPKKIAINKSTFISFAVLLDEEDRLNPNTQRSEISMFAFLPTLVKDFRFPFYINANFILDPPRQRILGDNPWNFFLMQEIAKCLVSWCGELCRQEEKNALNILIPNYFEEESNDTKRLAEHFNKSYKTSLENQSFILNHKGEIVKQEEIILDATGLSDIIGDSLFCEIIETHKSLPSRLVDFAILKEKIFDLVDSFSFDTVVTKLVSNERLISWLIDADEEKRDRFYKWIINNKDFCSELLSTLPVFQFNKEFLSLKEINDNKLYIITTELVEPIKSILIKLGFICSEGLLETHPLYECLSSQDEKVLFNTIVDRLPDSDLLPNEKLQLFEALSNFRGVAEQSLAKIGLFSNLKGDKKPLNEMMVYRNDASEWLHPFIICKEECFEELSNYLISSEDEFSKVIWENRAFSGMTITDFKKAYTWTDEQYTKSLISEYRGTDQYESLLPIIEEASKDVKIEYLSKIKSIELSEREKYDKDSFVYRVLMMALSIYEKPTDFSSKLFYKGNCIKEFTIKDEVVCQYKKDNDEEKRLTMSLSKLLPLSKTNSREIETIKSLFENKRNIDKFFEASSKPLPDIYSELLEQLSIPNREYREWNIRSNAQQYLFVVYYRRRYKGWFNSYIPSIKLSYQTDSFIDELMTVLYDNNVDLNDSPFTYKLKNEFNDKYFGKDYLLESEALNQSVQNWADNDKKKQYLFRNGVIPSSDSTLRVRQLFVANESIDEKEFDLSIQQNRAFLEYITQSGIIKFPIVNENQKTFIIQIKKDLDKERIKIITPRVNLLELENNSKEWDSEQYKSWIEDHYPMIYIFPNLIPKDLVFNNVVIMNFFDGNYYYDKNNKKLYITEKNKIDDTLFEIAKEGKSDFNIEDYQMTCREGKVLLSEKTIQDYKQQIKDLQSEGDKLRKEIDSLRVQLGKSSPSSTSSIIEKGDPDTLSKSDKYEAQLEAQRFLMLEMPDWDFPKKYGECDSEGIPYHFSTIVAKDEDENEIPLVLKSYKKQSEPFKINPEEWDYMMKKEAHLFIYDGRHILEIEPKDLILNQSSITITFSTENLDIEQRINAFAEALHYFKELHFDFESFNVSKKAKSIQEIFNKTTGSQQQFKDNEAL